MVACNSTDVFFQAMQDATLAIQNMMNAVESMGAWCSTFR